MNDSFTIAHARSKLTDTEPWVEARQAGISFDGTRQILADVNLQIPRAAFVSLVGASGCGKSTLLRLIAGLLRPTSGEVVVAGRPATDRTAERGRSGFVFQEPNLLPWRTVVDNIRLPLELCRYPHADRPAAVNQSLELIGLTAADGQKYPRMLSGGMRMRVSLARALVTRPELLLLDEPFAALDDVLRQRLSEELLDLWQAQQWTAVFVTHHVAEAVFLSQRVAILDRNPGRIALEVDIPAPYPRTTAWRASPEFAALTARISGELRRLAT